MPSVQCIILAKKPNLNSIAEDLSSTINSSCKCSSRFSTDVKDAKEADICIVVVNDDTVCIKFKFDKNTVKNVRLDVCVDVVNEYVRTLEKAMNDDDDDNDDDNDDDSDSESSSSDKSDGKVKDNKSDDKVKDSKSDDDGCIIC